MDSLEKLLYLRGISSEYYSYSGEVLTVPYEDRLQLLRETGDDPADRNAIEATVFSLDAKPWQSCIQPLHIVVIGVFEFIEIRVSPDQYAQEFQCRITTEAGDIIEKSFIPEQLAETGNYFIDQIRYSARRLDFENLPLGYHRISVESENQNHEGVLIVAPEKCFDGEFGNKKLWGINCQLYTLRSERNWGIGDFTDLHVLVELAADAGMDLISINPLHAPYGAEKEIASPYSPSDRRFLNPLYIDPENVPDFDESSAGEQCSKAAFRRTLSTLREMELIDYEAVAVQKYLAFELMYQHFVDTHIANDTDRAKRFQEYTRQGGTVLKEFADFESHKGGFNVTCARDPGFQQYLQWIAEQQLLYCQQAAKKVGMRIGLMRDLAVGAVREGAEVQSNPGLYCPNATIGAPPDPLAEQGQNWDLPALDPVALRRSGYQLFIDLLQANMKSCGGLRVDHILGLLRLWWCHPDIKNGAYVYYPMQDLLAILCLESQRNQCLIVGEDMGTVPDELRAAMSQRSIYSNKLLYFEKEQGGEFAQPASHQPDALLMVTNHDVPTLAGWWAGTDLQIREQIGLINSESELIAAKEQRRQDKRALLNLLKRQNVLPDSWCADSPGRDPSEQTGELTNLSSGDPLDKPFDFELCSATIHASAMSSSRMMLFQLDDLQLLEKPVNIPGTYKQYPNWRRKQDVTTRALFGDPKVQSLLSSINRENSNVSTY